MCHPTRSTPTLKGVRQQISDESMDGLPLGQCHLVKRITPTLKGVRQQISDESKDGLPLGQCHLVKHYTALL